MALLNDVTGSLTFSYVSQIHPGDLNVGDILTAGNNFSDAGATDPSLSGVIFTYHWWVGGVDVQHSVNPTFAITGGMVGQAVKVSVQFTHGEQTGTGYS